MQTFTADTEAEMGQVARQILKLAGERRKFALYGDLGAGKTTLVQAFCRALGVRETVASPTFSIINEYSLPGEAGQAVQPVFHMDLYRLRTLEEALDIGIEGYFDSPWYCFIEWPELIDPLLDEDAVRITLEILPDSARKIVFL